MEQFTWELLATMAGATAATTLIVQFLKLPFDKVWKIPTRIVVYVIAAIIMFAVLIATAVPFSFNNVALTLINAVVVALAAMGTYEVTFEKMGR